jgi:hypothetical protein
LEHLLTQLLLALVVLVELLPLLMVLMVLTLCFQLLRQLAAARVLLFYLDQQEMVVQAEERLLEQQCKPLEMELQIKVLVAVAIILLDNLTVVAVVVEQVWLALLLLVTVEQAVMVLQHLF